MARDQLLQLRVDEAEKRGFQAAADLAGISLSSWIRERLRLAAIRDLESAGQKIPFVERGTGTGRGA
jgi:antitoxin component of RelBE/YafQ-DinJ toxin-antitoxin module